MIAPQLLAVELARGVREQLGRARRASRTESIWLAIGTPRSPRLAAAAGELGDPRAERAGLGAERPGERGDLARARGGASRSSCAAASPRWSRRAGVPQTLTSGLAERVVHRQPGRSDPVGAEHRAEREVGAVAADAVGVEAAPRSARRRAAPRSRRRGWRAARRASRRRGRARSSRSRAADPPARWSSPRGRRGRGTDGRTREPPTRGRRGACGSRSSARPRAWSGSRRPRPPRTAAIALAASTTRPPPKATRRSSPTSSRIAAETSGTWPAATRWTRPRRSRAGRRRLGQGALGGEQLELVPAVLGERLAGAREQAIGDDHGAPPSALAQLARAAAALSTLKVAKARPRTRTGTLFITSQVLYQLS